MEIDHFNVKTYIKQGKYEKYRNSRFNQICS